jgi:hypothetical protein
VSTTVDDQLLAAARRLRPVADSVLLDEALGALLGRHRAAEIDAAYAAYERDPLEAADEWGDLASWHRAADADRR